MGSVRAEFLKLKRSMSWAVVVLLPVTVVVAGAVSTLVSGAPPGDGWHTVWLRSVVFYGLFPLPVGIAIVASLVWRVEHRGGNWNALMSAPTTATRLLFGKAIVVTALSAAMQTVLLVAVIVLGKLVFGLAGMLPAEYFVISVVIVVGGMPVAVLQSGVSMLLRSFAAPVAVSFLGTGMSVVFLLTRLEGAATVLPYALVSRATQLGTGTFADTGQVTVGTVAVLVLCGLAQSGVLLAATAALLNRRDVHT